MISMKAYVVTVVKLEDDVDIYVYMFVFVRTNLKMIYLYVLSYTNELICACLIF